MPDILSIKTPDWELSVWSRNIESRVKTLTNTLKVRDEKVDDSLIILKGSILVDEVKVGDSALPLNNVLENQVLLPEPLFFENLAYEFEFDFEKSVAKDKGQKPQIRHSLSKINDVFHSVDRRGINSLRGAVNFGNDIGWFRLPLRYWKNDRQIDVSLSFQVLPTKMDLKNDLEAIHSTIDRHYPLWRFALAERTEQDTGTSNKHSDAFPLFWISLFKELQTELNNGIKLILHSPHSRLLPKARPISAERLKGKLPTQLSERVKQDIQSGNLNKRYSIDQKKLSVDTPENRFIKMVIEVSRTKLNKFSKIAEDTNHSGGTNRLSKAFFEQIDDWQKPLLKQLNHPLFKDVGRFTDMSRESLVLQQKPGYSKVYKVWQQLKLYLDVLGSQTTISMKSVAELYEVWSFLEIRRILLEELGFNEVQTARAKLQNKGHELTTVDGFNGAFEFQREDGIKISLAHEPVFRKDTTLLARSWLTTQKPDILLKVTFANKDWMVWLFDAKYRIKETLDSDDRDKFDQVPDDAINQMHRYRDALIHEHGDGTYKTKSRPVFGAFALYPGYFDQRTLGAEANHYSKAISEIGIGAFPLLPSSGENNGSFWLQEFLKEKLGVKKAVYPSLAVADKHYVNESSRIPYTGLEQNRYADLLITMPLGPKGKRANKYAERFEDGSAVWYHVPEDTIDKKYAKSIVNELRYCAVATISPGSNNRTVDWVWPVKSAKLKARSELTVEQAGEIKDSPKSYWLLELEKAFKLETPVIGFSRRDFVSGMKLTTLKELTSTKPFSEMQDVYQEFFGVKRKK